MKETSKSFLLLAAIVLCLAAGPCNNLDKICKNIPPESPLCQQIGCPNCSIPPTTTTTTSTTLPIPPTTTTTTSTTTTTTLPGPIPTPTPEPTQCFPPNSEDPNWSVANGNNTLQSVLVRAEQIVGNRCGSDVNETLGLLGKTLRAQGYCADKWADAVLIFDPVTGLYIEYHAVFFGNGCYLDNAYRHHWKYNGIPPTPNPNPTPNPTPIPSPNPNLCPVTATGDYFVDLIITTIGGNPQLYTATAKYCGLPVRSDIFLKCGTKCCTLGVDGGNDAAINCEKELSGIPTWFTTGDLQVTGFGGNPYNIKVIGGHGTLKACGKSGCSNIISF